MADLHNEKGFVTKIKAVAIDSGNSTTGSIIIDQLSSFVAQLRHVHERCVEV
jgi:hypothetical protein